MSQTDDQVRFARHQAKLEAQLQQRDAKIKERDAKIKERDDKIKERDDKIIDLEKRIQDLDDRILDYEIEAKFPAAGTMAAGSQALVPTSSSNPDLSGEVTRLQQELATSHASNKQLNDAINQLRKDLTTKDAKFAQLEGRGAKLVAVIQESCSEYAKSEIQGRAIDVKQEQKGEIQGQATVVKEEPQKASVPKPSVPKASKVDVGTSHPKAPVPDTTTLRGGLYAPGGLLQGFSTRAPWEPPLEKSQDAKPQAASLPIRTASSSPFPPAPNYSKALQTPYTQPIPTLQPARYDYVTLQSQAASGGRTVKEETQEKTPSQIQDAPLVLESSGPGNQRGQAGAQPRAGDQGGRGVSGHHEGKGQSVREFPDLPKPDDLPTHLATTTTTTIPKATDSAKSKVSADDNNTSASGGAKQKSPEPTALHSAANPRAHSERDVAKKDGKGFKNMRADATPFVPTLQPSEASETAQVWDRYGIWGDLRPVQPDNPIEDAPLPEIEEQAPAQSHTPIQDAPLPDIVAQASTAVAPPMKTDLFNFSQMRPSFLDDDEAEKDEEQPTDAPHEPTVHGESTITRPEQTSEISLKRDPTLKSWDEEFVIRPGPAKAVASWRGFQASEAAEGRRSAAAQKAREVSGEGVPDRVADIRVNTAWKQVAIGNDGARRKAGVERTTEILKRSDREPSEERKTK